MTRPSESDEPRDSARRLVLANISAAGASERGSRRRRSAHVCVGHLGCWDTIPG